MPIGLGTAAAIGTAGAVGGGLIAASGAKSAAKTQATAATQAADLSQQMYGQTRADLSPFRDAGAEALPGLSKLLGGPGSDATQPDYTAYVNNNPDLVNYWNSVKNTGQFADINQFGQVHYEANGQREGRALPTVNAQQAALENLPGYQFARDQGIQSINRSIGSSGQTGAQAKGIARFVTGLADKTYGDQVQRLLSTATLGSNAAAGLGTIGANTSATAGSGLIGAGTANAAGTVGATNAFSGALQSAASYPLTNKLLGGLYGGSSTYNI